MGFEIFLECQRFVFIRESAIPNQFPGFEFCGVRGFAGIVVWNPLLQIGGCAGIFLFWKIYAADDVDVPHRRLQPVFAQGGYAGHASPSAIAWLATRSRRPEQNKGRWNQVTSPARLRPRGLRRAPRFALRPSRGFST